MVKTLVSFLNTLNFEAGVLEETSGSELELVKSDNFQHQLKVAFLIILWNNDGLFRVEAKNTQLMTEICKLSHINSF